MSDVMLFGVLKMPYEMAMADELSRLQFYGYVQQLVRRVEAAEAAALSSTSAKAGEPNWQPIETAPKTGQILLTNGAAVAQGWWFDEPPSIREVRDLDGRYLDQHESDGHTGWMDCEGGMLPEPTHWMPLPTPPATLSTDKGA